MSRKLQDGVLQGACGEQSILPDCHTPSFDKLRMRKLPTIMVSPTLMVSLSNHRTGVRNDGSEKSFRVPLKKPLKSALKKSMGTLAAAVVVGAGLTTPASAAGADWYDFVWTTFFPIGGSLVRYPFDVAEEYDDAGAISDLLAESNALENEIEAMRNYREQLLRDLNNKLDERRREQDKLADLIRKNEEAFDNYYETFAALKDQEELIDRLGREADAIAAESRGLGAEIQNQEARLNRINGALEMAVKDRQSGQNQIMTGLPPDADFAYRLGNMNWSVSGDVRNINESGGPRLVRGTNVGVMFGGDMALGANSGVGFAVGYAHGSMVQTDPFGGGNITSNELRLNTRGFWGPNPDLLFDASLGYNFAQFRNARIPSVDTYNTHAFSGGFGVSIGRDLAPLWRAEGRLGWAGSFSVREASTDTSGFTTNQFTNTTGTATLSGRLLREFDDGNGNFFVDAALSAITNDTTPASLTVSPYNGEIGAGFSTALNDGATLSARAFVGSLFRQDRSEFGGSVSFGVSY